MNTHGNEDSDGTERYQLDRSFREAEQGPSSRAHQLEAIFEAMTDGIFVYDKGGHLLQMNRAARDLLGLDAHPGYTALSLEGRGALITQRYMQGRSLPLARWATARVLNGEVLTCPRALVRSMHRQVEGNPRHQQRRIWLGSGWLP